jgi:hypothetical protein
MAICQISINPFAEYLEATESRRRQILKEQMDPDPVRVPYYQLAKAKMKASLANSGDFFAIKIGIKELTARKPVIKWKISDRINSITALENYRNMLFPKLITENKLEIIRAKQKHLNFNGITIKISPNIIFGIMIDGVKHIGACKIHVSKGKPFSNKQSKVVATLLNQYLSNCVAGEDEYVNPELCFCLDPFAGTTINSFTKILVDMKIIKEVCEEIKKNFGGAQNQMKVA